MYVKGNWKIYLFWILLSEAVGALSGWLTSAATETYNTTILKPSLSPPGWIFPVVWTILFVLMGIGAARIYLSGPSVVRNLGLNLFVAQLAVNFLWSPIFFRLQSFGFAFFWLLLLWTLVFSMTLTFRETDPIAAKLQIPYLAWLAFAGYLNLGVWYLNR